MCNAYDCQGMQCCSPTRWQCNQHGGVKQCGGGPIPTPPPTPPPVDTSGCRWSTPTRHYNMLECMDGTECYGWDCCNHGKRGGRAKCPYNVPTMCAWKSCLGNTAHCCSNDNCASAGGPRPCRGGE